MSYIIKLFIALSVIVSSSAGWADDAEDMAEMQRQLNAEVMAQPFDPGDPARVDAYIVEAMKKGIKPVATPPKYWRPGYTCDHIRRHHYSYRAYRNCLYHHRYYGRYW